MSVPLVIADTETTGLHRVHDQIWEFAAVRREPSGIEQEMQLFIEHDAERCADLPEPFYSDHLNRWPGPAGATPREDAAFLIDTFFRGPDGSDRPHLIGAVPNFDEQRLWQLLSDHLGPGWREPWHHHLVDVENLAVGFLRGRFPDVPMDPPWDSDLVSQALGVWVPDGDRHTALGDVKWAMRIYDRVMKGL